MNELEKKQAQIEKGKIDDGKIKMTMNDPSLRGKVTSRITDPGGVVYWYIRFNVLLDAASVTKRSMNVTDIKNGYIMHVIITYDNTRNLIVLNPMDLYRQNDYYMLNVSRKVRSNKGRPMQKPVHIMFKIVGDKISDFEVIKDTARIPRPKKKPESVRRAEMREFMTQDEPPPEENAENAVESEKPEKPKARPQLPFGKISVQVQLAVLGLVWLGLSLFFNNFFVTLSGIILLFLGLIHLVAQLAKKQIRSTIYYDLGVRRFNAGNYPAANIYFKKSFALNPKNEMAQFGLKKSEKYLD